MSATIAQRLTTDIVDSNTSLTMALDAPVRWNSSTLRDEWLYRSNDLYMIRFKVWELTYEQVRAAVHAVFPERQMEVGYLTNKAETDGYAFLLTNNPADLPRFYHATFQYGSTVLRKVPKHIPPPSVDFNILTGKVPSWVTEGMLYGVFQRYSSDPQYPIVEIDQNNTAWITLSPDRSRIDDSLIAAGMQFHTILTSEADRCDIIIRPWIKSMAAYRAEHGLREQLYLERMKEYSKEKYDQEIRRRSIR